MEQEEQSKKKTNNYCVNVKIEITSKSDELKRNIYVYDYFNALKFNKRKITIIILIKTIANNKIVAFIYLIRYIMNDSIMVFYWPYVTRTKATEKLDKRIR